MTIAPPRKTTGLRWGILLAVAAACYIIFWMLGGLADSLILFPGRQPVDAGRAVRRTVPFDGGELEIWTVRTAAAAAGAPEGFVLDFGGNAQRAEYIAWEESPWPGSPVEIWAVNYPGYGGSSGPARLRRIPPAALAAYDALAAHAGGRPVFVQGTSLGCAAALHVARHRPVAGLFLRTPPPLRQLILGRFGWWNLWLLAWPVAAGVPRELDALACAAQVKAPAVFLLFENDEVVPFRYQKKVLDAYAGPKDAVVLRGMGHNSALEGPALADVAGRLERLWRRAASRPVAESHQVLPRR